MIAKALEFETKAKKFLERAGQLVYLACNSYADSVLQKALNLYDTDDPKRKNFIESVNKLIAQAFRRRTTTEQATMTHCYTSLSETLKKTIAKIYQSIPCYNCSTNRSDLAV